MILYSDLVFIKQEPGDAPLCNDPTFSFSEKWIDPKLKTIDGSDIRILAMKDTDERNENAFRLSVFDVPKDLAADLVTENKCIDRGTTIRVANHATVNGLGWRYQMVRAEMCTRLSKEHCEFWINPLDDEIKLQSALASFGKLIKGNDSVNEATTDNITIYKH